MIFNTANFEILVPAWVLITAGLSVSFIITFFAVPVIVRVAKIKHLYAMPNGRTSHSMPTPNLGGVAVFAGVILASVLFSSLASAHELKYIIAGMIILFFLGLKDDFIPLAPQRKLAGQFAATFFVVVPGNIRITDFHDFLGLGDISYVISIIVTFMLFMVLINSFNLIDGIDGLASSIGILCSVTFGLWFVFAGHVSYSVFSSALIGSLMAFFWYNVFGRDNKIFLGDTGSMIIGFLVAVFVVRFLEYENAASGLSTIYSAPAVALSVLIIPIYDTARVIFMRLVKWKSPFKPDKNHIHHRLLLLSKTHFNVTLIITGINICFIILGYFLQNLGNELLILIIILSATIASFIPMYLIRRRKRIGGFTELNPNNTGISQS